MFTDEYSFIALAGKGGDGFVSFARRKYQAFGGPDGGDGGAGGNVVLKGHRNTDSLNHFRNMEFAAQPGGGGGRNLKIGARGGDLEINVPLGTSAYLANSGAYLGSVCSSTERLVIAKGGTGGKGNTHFSTGRMRAPQQAEPGRPGQAVEVLLRYRLYADNALIEPTGLVGSILPELIGKNPGSIDYALYSRKPRWIRIGHDYRKFDGAYIGLDHLGEGEYAVNFLSHCYWARVLFVNLAPLGEEAGQCAMWLFREMAELPFKRLERIVVSGINEIPGTRIDPEDTDPPETEVIAGQDAVNGLKGALVGGTVD